MLLESLCETYPAYIVDIMARWSEIVAHKERNSAAGELWGRSGEEEKKKERRGGVCVVTGKKTRYRDSLSGLTMMRPPNRSSG